MEYTKSPDYYEREFKDKLERELKKEEEDHKKRLSKIVNEHPTDHSAFNVNFVLGLLVFICFVCCVICVQLSLVFIIATIMCCSYTDKAITRNQEQRNERMIKESSALKRDENLIYLNKIEETKVMVEKEKQDFFEKYTKSKQEIIEELCTKFSEDPFTKKIALSISKKFQSDIKSRYNNTNIDKSNLSIKFDVTLSFIRDSYGNQHTFYYERLRDLNDFEERVAMAYALTQLIKIDLTSKLSIDNVNAIISTSHNYSSGTISTIMMYDEKHQI